MRLLCIQTGSKLDDPKRMRYEAREFYLKSRQEMEELFKEAPEAITNTFAVAEMCEVKLPFGDNNYPVFSMPPEIKSEVADNVAYLKRLCVEGLKERYDSDYREEGKRSEDAEDQARVLSERIDYELGVIAKTGFNDYFLIVADFMKWAREQESPWARAGVRERVAWWPTFSELRTSIPCASACSSSGSSTPSGSRPRFRHRFLHAPRRGSHRLNAREKYGRRLRGEHHYLRDLRGQDGGARRGPGTRSSLCGGGQAGQDGPGRPQHFA